RRIPRDRHHQAVRRQCRRTRSVGGGGRRRRPSAGRKGDVLDAWLSCRPSGIHVPETGNETPMIILRARDLSLRLAPLIAAGMFCLFSYPTLAAEDPEPPAKGAAVTVLKAAKSCFAHTSEVPG